MDLSAIALRGLHQAQAKLEEAAARLVSPTASSPEGTPFDTVDLSAAAVALLSSRNEFVTNIKVLHTADEIERQAINVFA